MRLCERYRERHARVSRERNERGIRRTSVREAERAPEGQRNRDKEKQTEI